jgi:F420H(2)-dependent quinone reductase
MYALYTFAREGQRVVSDLTARALPGRYAVVLDRLLAAIRATRRTTRRKDNFSGVRMATGLYSRVLRAHQWIYEQTNGLLGHRLLLGNPTLLLRTTGRRSGLTRTNALTYARDGDAYLVVASNGGSPRPPSWLANLKADPGSEIQVGRRRYRAVARPTLPDDPDYARRWTIVDTVNKGRYTQYQKLTERPIAIVELRPTSTV